MKKLKQARESKNLTQSELASRTGISQQHISMIENGERIGSVETLRELAKALDTSVDQLLS
ncbi:helix-turn-helix domain-containing protein [Ruminiclostridium cellulolyticum]|uniref:Transcriptional regulator, XRE family n=1 Tax=Ruminiclostridium cellulolyticum (strain ATCC 35319 / DSM 5812 / JCM 6584 / H10) TaxID=394503 RepID=B8I149_RUMCH|nr:helix-turn-helix transcriptional regulator [Ruminiclostridium cellulolyticum]ACL77605.1 transcriptional regulator, XRE family [Ruminiclostridium cellulolyticum H10]